MPVCAQSGGKADEKGGSEDEQVVVPDEDEESVESEQTERSS